MKVRPDFTPEFCVYNTAVIHDCQERPPELIEAKKMSFIKEPRGQGLLEYALVLLLIVLVVIAVIYLLGPEIGNLYSNVISNFP